MTPRQRRLGVETGSRGRSAVPSAKADRRHLHFLVILLVAVLTPVLAQSVVVSTSGGTVRVRSGFSFIEGELLSRLRDGRSVRLDFELTVSSQPGAAPLAQVQQSFNLSFDLWEERIAATRLGTPARSVSHLRPRDAEAWCLGNVGIPRTQLSKLGSDAPFWVRLAFQVPDGTPVADSETDETFTLRRLIDVLSRRTRGGDLGRSVEAGPFRLSDQGLSEP